jgi:predicted RecA/RadA family phage recombinase
MNNGIHEGNTLTWANSTGSDVASGDIVPVAGVLYVATVDIADGASGTLATRYAVKAQKVSDAVIAQGETLTWDVSAGAFDDNQATPATGDITGATAYAMAAAGSGESTLEVVLTGVPGAVN